MTSEITNKLKATRLGSVHSVSREPIANSGIVTATENRRHRYHEISKLRQKITDHKQKTLLQPKGLSSKSFSLHANCYKAYLRLDLKNHLPSKRKQFQ